MKVEIIYSVVFFAGLIATLSLLLAPAAALPVGGSRPKRARPIAGIALVGGGAGGLFARLVLEVSPRASLVVAAGWCVLLGLLARWGLATIERADERETFERAKLVGMTAVVSAGIQAGKVGQVTVQYAGMTRSLDASSDEDIERGAQVVVDDVDDGQLLVSRTMAREVPDEEEFAE